MKITMLCGFPASGKTNTTKDLEGFVISRDTNGGKTTDLLPITQEYIEENEDIVLDATFINKAARLPFIELAKINGVRIECIYKTTSLEDCQINALTRMWDRYGQMFMTADDIKNHPKASKDPNMFPIAALFRMRKMLEKPSTDEGFHKVTKEKFVRKYNSKFKQKALFLDYDGTLRDVPETASQKYPIKLDEVIVLPNRTEVIKDYISKGYNVYGISNQSGIAKIKKGPPIPEQDIIDCFDETNKQLGIDIEVSYCPHSPAPISCYCRKPQVGMVMNYVMRDEIDIENSIFVGDRTTDKTTATRLGMTFIHADDFFKE